MDLITIITVCILYTVCGVELVLTLPIFDNEFVHIKVYIPHESANTKQIKSKHPLIHHAAKYRVNYKNKSQHRPLRRPIKNLPITQTAPVLEKFFLAELDKPRNNDNLHQHEYRPKYIEETFLIKEQFYNSKQNEKVNSLKAAEDYKHPVHIENDKNVLDDSPHIETLKFADLKPHYNYQQQNHVEYDYHIPKEEVIKVIEAPRHATFVNDNANYAHVPQVNEVVEENHNYPDDHIQWKQPMAQEITKSQEGYNLYRNALHTKYHHSQEPNVSIDDHSEYEQPKGSHPYFENFQEPFIATEPYTTNYNIKEDYARNVTKHQKHLPSSETPLDDSESHKDHFSNAVENPLAIETYKGYDSYNAVHVQGLGSGGYRYQML